MQTTNTYSWTAKASKDVQERYGIAAYRMEYEESEMRFHAIDNDGVEAASAVFEGDFPVWDPTSAHMKSIVSDPMAEGRREGVVVTARGQAGTVKLSDTSVKLSAEHAQPIIDEFNAYGQDLLRAAYPAGTQAAKTPKGLDGICYIAGIGAGVWPIGTLIFGPTAIGCAVYYLTHR
jgi:hypothetical protein